MFVLMLGLVTQVFAADIKIPKSIEKGFSELMDSKKAEEAWKIWTEFSGGEEQRRVNFVKAIDDGYLQLGDIKGIEIAKIKEISPSFRLYYITCCYEKGPLFFEFECYKKDDEWKVYYFRFSNSYKEWIN